MGIVYIREGVTKRSFRFWQGETLAVTMIGYALYYVVRKNLSIAMPLLGEIGVSKVQLGAFLACGGIVYGVGRFLNGIVADRNSAHGGCGGWVRRHLLVRIDRPFRRGLWLCRAAFRLVSGICDDPCCCGSRWYGAVDDVACGRGGWQMAHDVLRRAFAFSFSLRTS